MIQFKKYFEQVSDLDIENKLRDEYYLKYPNEPTLPELGDFVLRKQDIPSIFKLVVIDVKKFDELYKKDEEMYIGYLGSAKNSNISKARYNGFKDFLRSKTPIEASTVSVNSDGLITFTNGRHRYAVLRDMGMKYMPVSMDKNSIKNASKFGFLKNSVMESVAKATGRWYDFEIVQKVYEGKILYKNVMVKCRIYSGMRLGKMLYETQIQFRGQWKTVQYSTTLEEAKIINENI